MRKILFVVHRYVPFAGGSEYYVRDMAEEMLDRGYDVTVLAHEHQGDQNGVRVTNDYDILGSQKWDLILVHGGDVISQNIVHLNAEVIAKISPVAYMLIKPSESPICMKGLMQHKIVTYSTDVDLAHIRKHGMLSKARRIRHGVVPFRTVGEELVKEKRLYVSAGGFYPHKAMLPLAAAFEQLAKDDMELHLYGYGEGIFLEDTEKVKWFKGKPKEKVMDAIASANGYIMNSYEEGFGLVLLEAMMNKTPWFARQFTGAADQLEQYGTLYNSEDDLVVLLNQESNVFINLIKTENAFDYVMANHTITQTCNDIEDILNEL